MTIYQEKSSLQHYQTKGDGSIGLYQIRGKRALMELIGLATLYMLSASMVVVQ